MRIDSSRLRAITGICTLSSKLPLAPAQATAASLPTTCAHTIRVASGSTGLTLPGMMLDPGWRSGRWISASPVVGPDDSQRRSLQILVRPTAIVRSTPDSSTSESRVPCASKWLRASVNSCPVSPRQRRDHRGREAGRGVDAGADGGAAEGELADAGEYGAESLCGVRHASRRSRRTPGPSITGVASIRCVRPALTSPANSVALADSDASSWPARAAGRRRRRGSRRHGCAVGKVSLEDCDALTWSFGCTSTPVGASVARTSFMFMLELVPEPVWKTSSGKASRCSPAATVAAAAAIAGPARR